MSPPRNPPHRLLRAAREIVAATDGTVVGMTTRWDADRGVRVAVLTVEWPGSVGYDCT